MNTITSAPLDAVRQLRNEYLRDSRVAQENERHAVALRLRYQADGITEALRILETFEGVAL